MTHTNMVLAAYNNLATTTACDIYNLGVADVTKFSNITCAKLKFLGKWALSVSMKDNEGQNKTNFSFVSFLSGQPKFNCKFCTMKYGFDGIKQDGLCICESMDQNIKATVTWSGETFWSIISQLCIGPFTKKITVDLNFLNSQYWILKFFPQVSWSNFIYPSSITQTVNQPTTAAIFIAEAQDKITIF